jgi:hypothetical protein
MTKALYSALAGVAVLALSSGAFASEPMSLSNTQLDSVTAGATSVTQFFGASQGNLGSAVLVNAINQVAGPNAAAAADVTSVATSTIPGAGAAAVSALRVAITSP